MLYSLYVSFYRNTDPTIAIYKEPVKFKKDLRTLRFLQKLLAVFLHEKRIIYTILE